MRKIILQNHTEAHLLKKDEIYRIKSKRKVIKTLTRKKKALPKKTKTLKVVEPKENNDLEIIGFKSISHPRTRK